MVDVPSKSAVDRAGKVIRQAHLANDVVPTDLEDVIVSSIEDLRITHANLFDLDAMRKASA